MEIMFILISHSKCDVMGPKKYVPMGTKVRKVPNKLYKGYLHKMWTLRQNFIKIFLGVNRGSFFQFCRPL